MHWVVQENLRKEAGYDKFLQALVDLGISHTIVKVIPFIWDTVPEVKVRGFVTAWGSLSMTKLAWKHKWEPGVWLNENFDQRVWTAAYGNHCLNLDVEFHEFCKVPEFEGERFIRPVHVRKVLTGSVFDWTTLQKQQERLSQLSIRFSPERKVVCPDTPVSISSVKSIASECRLFIVDRVVRGGSLYQLHGDPVQEEIGPLNNAWAFAQQMTNVWNPASAYVLDVACVWDPELIDETIYEHCNVKTEGDWAYKVVEINCINSCGFYAANMRPVIQAIERMPVQTNGKLL